MKINIENLSIRISEKNILEDINLEIYEPFTAIIGPNGAGKSTLLKSICQSISPSSGTILFNGKNLSDLKKNELAKLRAFVSAEEIINNEMLNVNQYISFGRSPYQNWFGSFTNNDYEIIEKVIEQTGVKDLKYKNINELSSGEKQRVQISRALAQEPKLLLLDEPTSHLDIKFQIDIMKLLKQISSSGVKVIAILHDLNLAASFCDKCILLKKGKLIKYGSPENIFNSETLENLFSNKWDIFSNPLRVYPKIEIDV